MKKIAHYADTCTIIIYKLDAYGDKVIVDEARVPCLFNWGYSENHSNHVDNIATDATACLDIDDPFIQKWKYRLEGQYLIFDRHEEEAWFKIQKVDLGITLLTDNIENNCFVRLEKSVSQV